MPKELASGSLAKRVARLKKVRKIKKSFLIMLKKEKYK
jgi:hypothetical protein